MLVFENHAIYHFNSLTLDLMSEDQTKNLDD